MKCSTVVLLALFLCPIGLIAQDITGTWLTDIPGPEEGSTMTVNLTIADGTYQVDFGDDGQVEINGKYELEDSQITVWDIDGEGNSCKGVKGVYNFEVSETDLIMTRVSDPCENRGGPDGMRFTRK
ncbi:MAG: hypothetical protein GYB31_07705 [Bacteroidetes bacterium]|nr:hypothetical protein [Bacteroidota bacterium]